MISVRRKKVEGRKNRKVTRSESDWKVYTSSSKYVNEDIEKIGKHNFNFTIIEWCYTAGELHSREIELLVENRCVDRANKMEDGERAWYNANIPGQKFLTPEFQSESTRQKIQDYWNNNPDRKKQVVATFRAYHFTEPLYAVHIKSGQVIGPVEGEQGIKGVIGDKSTINVYRCASKIEKPRATRPGPNRWLSAHGFKWYWESDYYKLLGIDDKVTT